MTSNVSLKTNMHLSFAKAVKQPQVVDKVINIMFPCTENQRFSKVFHNLFPDSLEHNNNMKTFLGIFEDFQNSIIPDFRERQAVDLIYEKLGITKSEDGVYQFWVYLIQMHQQIRNYRHRPNFDNVFAFMNEFPIQDVRVVIIGQDPSPLCESSGFAFHGSICPSTANVIDFLNEEFKLVDIFTRGGKPLTLSNEELDKHKENCNLSGWIKQGVLMINAKLTFGEDLWTNFTDYLVKYISDFYPNIVFILAGGLAAKKGKLINKRQHLVMGVYHPINQYQKYEHIRWDAQLPFLNANFFLFQVYREKHIPKSIINWEKITNYDETQDHSLLRLTFLYENLLSIAKAAPKLTSQYAGEFVHPDYKKVLKLNRLRSGYYILKQTNPYASLQSFKDHIKALEEVESEKVIFQMRNNLGRTILHEAINRLDVDLETFKRLFTLSGDINATDNNGNNMLMTAQLKRRYQSLIELMIKFGAKTMTIGSSRQNCLSFNDTAVKKSKENAELLEAPACKRPRIS